MATIKIEKTPITNEEPEKDCIVQKYKYGNRLIASIQLKSVYNRGRAKFLVWTKKAGRDSAYPANTLKEAENTALRLLKEAEAKANAK